MRKEKKKSYKYVLQESFCRQLWWISGRNLTKQIFQEAPKLEHRVSSVKKVVGGMNSSRWGTE